jgi:hypothetical protein
MIPLNWQPWATRVLLTLLLFILLPFLDSDHPRVSTLMRATIPYGFSLEGWIFHNLPKKWTHQLQQIVPGQIPSQERRRETLREYFRLSAEARKIQEALPRRIAGDFPTESELTEIFGERLLQIERRRDTIRYQVEDTLERELTAVLKDQGLQWELGPFSVLFPPVDLRLEYMPDLLVFSLRDRITLLGTHLVQGKLTVEDKEILEGKSSLDPEISALVMDITGLAAYPTMISDTQRPRAVLDTMAHEWLHQYWFFRPLGFSYNASSAMTTLNETAADIAGRELGELIFQRIGEQIPISPVSTPRQLDPDFDFRREMRKTRLAVDNLLDQGKVESAEQYMESRRNLFVENGYRIRKLNQAYFAFKGLYGESAASASPIAEQLQYLRSVSPDIGTFVRTMAGFNNYREFLSYISEPPDDSRKRFSFDLKNPLNGASHRY